MNHIYEKYEYPEYNIYTIKSSRFKRCRIEVRFTNRLVEGEVTSRNFLRTLLLESTKKYPKPRLVSIYEEDLYKSYTSSSIQKCGNYLLITYGLSFINPKYTEDGMLKKSIEYFSEVLFNPNITDGKYDKNSFNNIMNNGKNFFKTVNDSPDNKAGHKFVSVIGKGTNLAILTTGNKKDLLKINRENIVRQYKKWLDEDHCDIYIYGDIDMDQAVSLIRKNFKINSTKKANLGQYLNIINNTAKVKNITIHQKCVQSIYIEGYTFDDLTEFERFYVVKIFNHLFGVGQESKLFLSIRKKHSLCYQISSNYNDFYCYISLKVYIDVKNIKKCKKLIRECLDEMISGNFSEEELKQIIREKINDFDFVFENQKSTISYYYENEILHDDTIEVMTEKLLTITKQDIMNVAKKIHLHTTVLLRDEVKNEKASI